MTLDTRKAAGLVFATMFLASIVIANWLTSTYGFVPVGLGLAATAGTFAAGFALAFRDATQDTLGRWNVLIILLVGVAISYVIADPTIALASAAAFALSELADFAIYTKIRKNSKLGSLRWGNAAIVSNITGAVIDTVVFIGLAFGFAAVLPAMAGQLVGKLWATITYVLLGKVFSLGSVLREPHGATSS